MVHGRIKRLAIVLQISCYIPSLQMVCNTVMSLINNSVCPLIDQGPKVVPGHTFNDKGTFTQPSKQNDTLNLYYNSQKIEYTK